MKPHVLGAAALALLLVGAAPAFSAPTSARKATLQRLDGITIMDPTPTQANSPGLRLRSMVRPADRLWIGPALPAFVAPVIGRTTLDLLDPKPLGGWVATYRERFDHCGVGEGNRTCAVLIKTFDAAGKEELSIALDDVFSRRTHLEAQDVRYVEEAGQKTLYFNEACQSYSRDAGGKCSALVAFDPVAKKVRWRTGSLVSNNEFVIVGGYLVTAYGFTGEKASIRVVRRSDGKIMDKHSLVSTNFEMRVAGEHLSVEMYSRFGRANFRLEGFDTAAPHLVALATTPPDPQEKPKPYDPPLTHLPSPGTRDRVGF